MKCLLKGGTVVSGTGQSKLDVLIEGEQIVAVGEDLSQEDAQVEDVSGKYLFPGFIDAHTHMDLEVSGTVTADGFESGTKAEVAGGTTCIIDFATQNKGESLAQALENWHRKAEGVSSCDYGFHLAISDWNESIYEELEEVVNKGVRSFKLYMTYDAMVVDDKTIYEILTRLKELGAITGVHCENKGIIDARLEELLREKKHRRDVADYPGTRPAEAEAEAIHRLLAIAKCVDTPVIVVHLSSALGYRQIEEARAEGQQVYVETCPQYLVMDDSKYSLGDGRGRNYMIAPPLRKKMDQDVLWTALNQGQIQTIATDHCSFNQEQKSVGEADFAVTPCGMPGAQERPALIYEFGVNQGRISLEQMCEYLSENAAKIYGLYPRKGVIQVGSDADIVVWNPEKVWTISEKTQQSKTDYAPLEGTKIKGCAEMVFLRGRLVAKDGDIIAEYAGRYVR